MSRALLWRAEYGTSSGDPTWEHAGAGAEDWAKLPTQGKLQPDWGIVRVRIFYGHYEHVLLGMDAYWLGEGVYGMLNDPENRAWYDGAQSIAYAWPTIDQQTPLADATPPAGVHIVRGVMLPDWQARQLGILPPDASSPPRPRP